MLKMVPLGRAFLHERGGAGRQRAEQRDHSQYEDGAHQFSVEAEPRHSMISLGTAVAALSARPGGKLRRTRRSADGQGEPASLRFFGKISMSRPPDTIARLLLAGLMALA